MDQPAFYEHDHNIKTQLYFYVKETVMPKDKISKKKSTVSKKKVAKKKVSKKKVTTKKVAKKKAVKKTAPNIKDDDSVVLKS